MNTYTFKVKNGSNIIFIEKYAKKYNIRLKIIYKNKLYQLKGKFPKEENNSIKFKIISFGNKIACNKLFKEFKNEIEFNELKKNCFRCSNVLEFSVDQIFKLVYKINKENENIKLFGEEFVENNKNDYNIIYNNKIFPLQTYFLIKDIKDNKNKLLEIFLINSEILNYFKYEEILNNDRIHNINCIFIEDEDKYKENKLSDKYEEHKSSNELYDLVNSYPLSEISQKESNSLNFISDNIVLFYSKFNKSKSDNLYKFILIHEKLITLSDIVSILFKSQTTKNMSYLFNKCSSLISLPDISNLDTRNINNMSYMFSCCSSLTSLPDISNWNTSNVQSMRHMFSGCLSLKSLPNISNWDTNNCEDIRCMFSECPSLMSLPDISVWNTDKITNISGLFRGCSSLISIPDISNWDISEINDISFIFKECLSIVSLPDISNWNTSNIKTMSELFYECSSLISLPDISKWDISNILYINDIFEGCTSLISISDITSWLEYRNFS